MQKELYKIQKLPKNSIKSDSKRCNRKDIFYKIEGDTFHEIHEDLRIRPKAADFAKYNKDVYAVLYITETKAECLFLFKFVHSTQHKEIAEIQLCRCLGKMKTKHYKNTVKTLLETFCYGNFIEWSKGNWHEFTSLKEK